MSRTRTSGVLAVVPIQYTWTGGTSSTITTGNPGLGSARSMTDIVIPDYKLRSSKGEVFFNPMTATTYNCTQTSTSPGLKLKCNYVGDTDYGNTHTWSRPMIDRQFALTESPAIATGGYFNSPFPITSSEIVKMKTEASTQAAAKRGMSQNNLFESLAEIDKSFKMLPDTLHQIRSIIKGKANSKDGRRIQSLYTSAIRQAKSPSVASSLYDRSVGPAANLYLMYRYGIKPLINDVQGIIDGARKKIGPMRLTSRGSVQQIFNRSEARSRSIVINGKNASTYTMTIDYQKVAKVRGMFLDELDVSMLFNMGFSAKGLLGLPWELTRFSFVLDWFVNLGDFMYALMPTPETKALGSCVTFNSVETIICQGETLTGEHYSMEKQDSGVVTVYRVVKERTPGVSAPGIVIKTDFGFSNITRSMDAAALLVQTMKTPFRF